jgi:hypothetical protein
LNIIQDRKKIKVGVISDGKYGTRAYENIKKVFETEWILVPEIPSNVMLDDDIEVNVPNCDLYISYVRHPDVILQMVELQKPIILGVLPGVGLYQQAKRTNSRVVHAPTMCSLENNTGIPEVDAFTEYFGRPIFKLMVNEEEIITNVKVTRSSLCGSSKAGAKFLVGRDFKENILQEFALNVCHECRAPRFGHTCDKEVAGIIHLVSLLESISPENYADFNEDIKLFIDNIKKEHEIRNNNSRIILEQVS